MQSGEYDGVSASGDATQRLMSGGEVAAARPRRVHQLRRHLRRPQGQAVELERRQGDGHPARSGRQPVGVQHRGVPRRPRLVGRHVRRQRRRRRAVSVYDSPIYIADAALYLMATQPDLGITNPYALDQDQFDAVDGPARGAEVRSSASTGPTTSCRRPRWSTAPCWPARPGRSSQPTPRARRQDRHGEAEGRRDGLERHVDAVVEGREPQLHEHVDGLHHVPVGQRQATEYFGEAPSNRRDAR